MTSSALMYFFKTAVDNQQVIKILLFHDFWITVAIKNRGSLTLDGKF